MARLGFWWRLEDGAVEGVMLYPGASDLVSGEEKALPPEVVERMAPEELAAWEAGELAVRIGGMDAATATMVTDAQMDLAVPVVWEMLRNG